MLTGKALIEDVNCWSGPANSLAFWWLGQASFIIKLGGRVVYIDPYLSADPRRRTPPLLRLDEATNADLVVCSHNHTDHIDPGALPGIATASPCAVIVVPKAVEAQVVKLGIASERIVGLNDAQTWDNKGLTVTAIKAKHEFFDPTAEGNYPYLSYVICAGNVCVYHAGDTLVYDGLIGSLRLFGLTVAFVPINGRDAERYKAGCIGNMTYQEAVDFVGELEPRLAVPMHYEMFAHNSQDPQLFVDYLHAKYPQVKSWAGLPGQRVEVRSQPEEI